MECMCSDGGIACFAILWEECVKQEWDLIIISPILQHFAILRNVRECLLGKQHKIWFSSWNEPVAGYQECRVHWRSCVSLPNLLWYQVNGFQDVCRSWKS